MGSSCAGACLSRATCTLPNPRENWRTITNGDFRTTIRRIGQALLNRKLSAERPLVELPETISKCASHACGHVCRSTLRTCITRLLLWVKDFTRLAEIIKVVQPGLIYANNLGAFGRALNAISLTRVEFVTSQPCDLAATAFDELVENP